VGAKKRKTMSSSLAARKRAEKMNTPENIKKWCELYTDGLIDGDKIELIEPMYSYPAGTVGTIEIRYDSRVNSPVRAVILDNGEGFCGPPPMMKFKKIQSAPTEQ
jgi:hypothetical protein